MNITNKTVVARFAPETEFQLDPLKAAAAANPANLEGLRIQLLAGRVAEAENEPQKELYFRAAREAAELARLTEYPALVFPVLFEERSNAQGGPLTRSTARPASCHELVEV